MNEELKTSEEWHKTVHSEIKILDPDGWDRRNYQYSFYEEKITEKEFNKRLMISTCMVPQSYLQKLWMEEGNNENRGCNCIYPESGEVRGRDCDKDGVQGQDSICSSTTEGSSQSDGVPTKEVEKDNE